MKLKTLKDLWKGYPEIEEEETEQIGFIEELKQEAIKWVKKIDNPEEDVEVAKKLDLYNLCKTQEEVENCLFGARRMLITMNNITEDDLK